MIHKTTRSILSVLLAALLLVTSIPLTPAFAGGGKAVPPQSANSARGGLEQDGDGTYLIYTADDLKEFADIVNGIADTPADKDANAKLMNDIDLNGSEENPWTPIGNSSPYRGTFNGAGHTISGLYINRSDSDQGLFGYVSGTVQNLSVSGSVKGDDYVGGVVGQNNGTVTNCAFSGSVSGVGPVGGVVGYNISSVTNCYNTGEVSGNWYVGGVVGQNSGSSIVENCYNTGAVNSSGNRVGGVVGDNSGIVTNCYNTGAVSGGADVGGVVGYNDSGIVENCYNIGKVTGSADSSNVGGVVGQNRGSSSVTNCYNTGAVNSSGNRVGGVVGDNSGIVTNCYNTGAVSGGADVGGVVGYNDSGIVENCYNIGKVTGSADSSNVGGVVGQNRGSSTVTGCYFLQQDPAIYGIGNENTHTGATPVNDLDALCENFESDPWIISDTLNRPVLKDNHEDDGSEDHPYEIFTAAQLENFRDLVNRGGAGASAHAKLMNNIDLNPDMKISEDGTVTGAHDRWIPIGNSESTAYTGTFNGNGHKIENLYINTTDSGADNQGLFGYVGSSGIVQNLSVSGTVIGRMFVGGIAGRNGGNVINCAFSGSVSGNSPVGGVVGSNSFSATVTNCYNTGTVTGTNEWVGGVVGVNSSSVTNCYNIGDVSGGEDVGGVVGYNSSIVVDNNSGTVKNCYNTGNISGKINVGGVVGHNDGGSITNCYYQIDKGATVGIGGTTADDTTTVAKTAAAFHSGEVAYLLQSKQTDESGLVWGQNLMIEPKDNYPQLRAFDADTPQVYKVAFMNDSEEHDAKYANSGMTVTIPAAPSREGHTFTGWSDGTSTYQAGAKVEITSDTKFTAQWTKDTVNYTVTVSASPAEGGTVNGGGTFTENDSVTVSATPASGYTFVEWQEDGEKIENAAATYTFELTGNRNLTAIFEKEPIPTPTPTPDPTPSGPSTGDSSGWDDIRDELENAEKGDQITIDMGDETKVPAEVFETLAGQDITLEIALEGGVTWTVNGQDIPADANLDDLDLGVEMGSDGIPVEVVNAITGEHGSVQIELAHDGAFGFAMTLTAPLGVENAGYWANLYHYDEDAEALNFEAAAKIDEDGSVTIPFSHASQYAIVIDTHSHATVDVSDLFIDIAPDAWYKDAIQYAYDNGLMTGVSDTEFAPEATTTRAMIVSILARLEGVESAQAAGFADVDDNDWYATAVNWAANVGVVNGYEDNTFRPNTAITREQLAAILMNYAAYKGEDVSNRADLTSYTDQPSTWAEEAMSWAVAEGLISGVTADTLQPQGAATRAQVAAILQRFLSE